MAIADSKALLSEIMNAVDDHVTAKASRQLEQQIMDILDGYQITTMIRDDSGVNRLKIAAEWAGKGFCITPNLCLDAADAIEELVKICNSILSKYEEAAESVIYEYSGNIDEDIDELHKEIEDYKAQINGVAEQPKEET